MLSSNIKEARENARLTQSQLALKMGLSVKTIVDYEKGKRDITVGNVMKIADICDISFYELTDTKPIISQKLGKAFKKIAQKTMQQPQPIPTEELSYINDYDVELSAGTGSYSADHPLAVGRRAFSTKWIKDKGLKAQNLSLVRVHGDSMEPLLKDKDIVMIDESKTNPSDKYPFACLWEHELYVKLLQLSEPGKISLVSVNKQYDSQQVVLSWQNFNIIGAVVWHAHSWL